MISKGRGTTHNGRRADVPEGQYDPALNPKTVERSGRNRLIIHFQGEDGRATTFDVGTLPLPGWHRAVADSWALRIGGQGSLRTLASVSGPWLTLTRFIRFLADRPKPPPRPASLKREDVEAFARYLKVKRQQSWVDIRYVANVLCLPPLRDLIAQDVHDFMRTRAPHERSGGKPGYSEREYRQIKNAARSDVAAARERIGRGRELVGLWNSDRDALFEVDLPLAEQLADIARSGIVPNSPGGIETKLTHRLRLAQQLFVTPPDVKPMMLLMVALTGLNAESIKELTTQHRVIEGRAVEVEFIKRRGGAGRWRRSATWEIGPPGRELYHPGGLYLLLADLMSSSRHFAASDALWAVWRNGFRSGGPGVSEHFCPFEAGLATYLEPLRKWETNHGLTADTVTSKAASTRDESSGQEPLVVTMQRLRTTVEIRRTKQYGGHLPSAARTNTVGTLFAEYLRDDPVVLDWAADTVSAALEEAERSALDAHRRSLVANGGSLDVSPDRRETSEKQTAWAECKSPASHPDTGRPCRATFLACFHCSNCLITFSHLPRLLALFDVLTSRRQILGLEEWWSRYGSVWVALKRDIFPRFTPEQLESARREMPGDALLDLVEEPWEAP